MRTRYQNFRGDGRKEVKTLVSGHGCFYVFGDATSGSFRKRISVNGSIKKCLIIVLSYNTSIQADHKSTNSNVRGLKPEESIRSDNTLASSAAKWFSSSEEIVTICELSERQIFDASFHLCEGTSITL